MSPQREDGTDGKRCRRRQRLGTVGRRNEQGTSPRGLTAEPVELGDAAAGFDYAQRAIAASDGTDGSILATLAMAYHLNGDHQMAVETAEKALSLLSPDNAPARREVEANLRLFRAATGQANDITSSATKPADGQSAP